MDDAERGPWAVIVTPMLGAGHTVVWEALPVVAQRGIAGLVRALEVQVLDGGLGEGLCDRARRPGEHHGRDLRFGKGQIGVAHRGQFAVEGQVVTFARHELAVDDQAGGNDTHHGQGADGA
ncbi:Uncharacterised protein [Mycobacteroides abscessus subsp. abscessus]|nr:Uncharacterised protein [Mycobacteroides abscessus subsp. abscessus]